MQSFHITLNQNFYSLTLSYAAEEEEEEEGAEEAGLSN